MRANAIKCGMTEREFRHSTLRDINLRLKVYYEEKEYRAKEIGYQSWLTGLYVLNAIGCSSAKGKSYPDNPLSVKHKTIQDISKETGKSKEELAQEEQYFTMRVRQANANIEKARDRK